MSEPIWSPAKSRFLKHLKVKLIPADVCAELNIRRAVVEEWIATDETFRKRLRMLELEIKDKAKKIAFQQMGLLPFAEGDQRSVNTSLIKDFLQGDMNLGYAQYDDDISVPGVSEEIVKNLARPEAKKDKILPGVVVAGPEPKPELPAIPAEDKKPEIPVDSTKDLTILANAPEAVQ